MFLRWFFANQKLSRPYHAQNVKIWRRNVERHDIVSAATFDDTRHAQT